MRRPHSAKDITQIMKRIYMITMGLMLGASSLFAQPGSVQKAAKSVFSLTTFDKDGNIISSTQGVFIDNKGTAISTFKPFVGAVKASIVDATGKTMDVDAIMGADELYDVAKFRVQGNTAAATIAPAAETAGSKVWLVPYSIKKPQFQQEDISGVEKFKETYNYYVFSSTAPDNAVGCPFVNKNGQVIGIMHSNGQVTAVDANYAKGLQMTGLSTLDAALKQTGIRTALPDTEQDALTMMTINKGQTSRETYGKYADEFLAKFPASAFGYKEKATLLVEQNEYADAAKCMEEGIKKAADKAEAHSAYSDLIYQKIIYKGDSAYTAWTYDKSIDEAQKAYAIQPNPVYRHQEARVRYSKGEYQKAYDMFMDLTKTSARNGEVFLEAAQSKMQLKAPGTEVKALLDSAVNVSKDDGVMAGNYYLARAEYLASQGEYRSALADYNQYDSISHPAHAPFFYARYKAEAKLRMWQQALVDIARTCYLAPQEPTYFAEWASLDLRVKRYEEGISAAKHCTQIAPEYADGYLLLGLLQIENKQPEEARKNLEKAKELGDSRADGYLQKLK